MTFTDPIPEGTICISCKERPATQKWTGMGGLMDALHGDFTYRCKICCLVDQLEHAEKVAAEVAQQKEELAEEKAKFATS